MKVIYNKIIPIKGFTAINIFGLVFARNGYILKDREMNHESIHTAQMREMGYIGFYIWYLIEWLIKLFKHGRKAYENISFEREAYTYQYDPDYLKKRKHYAWFHRMWVKQISVGFGHSVSVSEFLYCYFKSRIKGGKSDSTYK